MTPRFHARRNQAFQLVEAASHWAAQDVAICALALVGSYARDAEKMSSDVDLVVLTATPSLYIDRLDWISYLSKRAHLIRTAQWGPVTEQRLRLRSGLHVDIGFTTPAWAALPLDAGTLRVLSDGNRILYDPTQQLLQAANAATSQPKLKQSAQRTTRLGLPPVGGVATTT